MRLARSDQRPRQRHGRRVALGRQLFDRRAAGIGQAEQLRRLVERLAGRIVDRRRQPAVVADRRALRAAGNARPNQQQQIGKIEIGIDQPRAQRVAFEMIDRDERLAGAERDALAREQRDHHPADQAGPRGRGDGVDLGDRLAGFRQHARG